MTNIFVSPDDITVIGGTDTVNVEVDFGPQGDRGSSFFVGFGDPNTASHDTPLQLLDSYINIQTTDEDYMVIYQYVSQSGVNTWVPVGPLMTDKFSAIRQVAFTDGKTTSEVDFKISNIVPTNVIGGITKENFNVQCTFADPDNPIAHSIIVKDLATADNGDQVLPVDINAVEFVEGSTVSLNGTFSIHFLITVV
jgi:hypothetical protein